ncbi:MAG: tRNA (5-methylaminomethyl-2-thiouridine)(34)-methyltransferase MnmD [Kangiella sp.]|nr:tRNA (5-methylaminomethyl-2-thiouridine)(34)-methyltransferase MnmD [Kangiella sp.]
MHNAFLGVEPANIEWRPAKIREGSTESPPLVPYSKQFNDIYFDSRDGKSETDYVFLDGNKLPQRFEALTEGSFTIVETGFGTGLNLLRTCELWRNTQKDSRAILNFISIEQYPISPDDLQKMYLALGVESEFTEELLAQYPPAMPGVYTIQLPYRIKLTLILCPIDKALKEFAAGSEFKVDAWYLDGFAPSKNPEMWAKSLLHFMSLHAINSEERQTTFATFTAASAVRKQLRHYGFEVAKQKGFGFKREMLVGSFQEKTISSPHPTLADSYFNCKTPKQAKVAIIGAGLAGCATAHSLHRRGIEVHLFESGNSLASGASKMPALLATPNISLDHNAFSQLTFLGMSHLESFLHAHNNDSPQLSYSKTCLQLGSGKYSEYQLEQYVETYRQRYWNPDLFQWTKTSIESQEHRGLLMPGTLVNGSKFCEALVASIPKQQIHLNHKVKSLEELNDFDHIVLATGHGNLLHKLADDEPSLSPLRGQLTELQQHPKQRLGLDYPINYDGHLFEYENKLIVGATFDLSLDQTINLEDRVKNIEQANKRFGLQLKQKECTDWVGIRATTYDRFPYCGPLKVKTELSPMIWTNYGMGTRGLCLSLLCGEVIASSINKELIPLPKYLLQRISPQRTQK